MSLPVILGRINEFRRLIGNLLYAFGISPSNYWQKYLATTLDKSFCLETQRRVFQLSKPEIFNTDKGPQFTSVEFTGLVESEGVKVSMDGRGRVYDNIFIERIWRSVKYEEVYLHEYAMVAEARAPFSLLPFL